MNTGTKKNVIVFRSTIIPSNLKNVIISNAEYALKDSFPKGKISIFFAPAEERKGECLFVKLEGSSFREALVSSRSAMKFLCLLEMGIDGVNQDYCDSFIVSTKEITLKKGTKEETFSYDGIFQPRGDIL